MKQRTWWVGGVAGVAAAAMLAWAFAPRPVEVELAAATVGRFELTVDEDGKTRLADRYVVSAPLAARVARITLREGDAVADNAPVATLTPVMPAMLDERTLRELQARLEGAQAGVERAATRIERAKVALQQAASDARRSEQLSQQGFVAATKLDSDRLAVLAAQKEVEAANADRHVATHEVEQARAALSATRLPAGAARQRSFGLRSPVAGQVLRVLQTSEATVALGTPLLELGDTSRLEVVAELLTTDALAAKPGSPVQIERWGGSGLLEGRVSRVEPGAFTKVSALGVEEQRVRVIVALTTPREVWQSLGDGYRVGVRIVTLAQDKALQVPVSAVFPLPAAAPAASAAAGKEAAQHAVFVAEGGRARLQPVTLASRNGSMAWLRTGLEAGAQVIVYPPASVREGVRISERKV